MSNDFNPFFDLARESVQTSVLGHDCSGATQQQVNSDWSSSIQRIDALYTQTLQKAQQAESRAAFMLNEAKAAEDWTALMLQEAKQTENRAALMLQEAEQAKSMAALMLQEAEQAKSMAALMLQEAKQTESMAALLKLQCTLQSHPTALQVFQKMVENSIGNPTPLKIIYPQEITFSLNRSPTIPAGIVLSIPSSEGQGQISVILSLNGTVLDIPQAMNPEDHAKLCTVATQLTTLLSDVQIRGQEDQPEWINAVRAHSSWGNLIKDIYNEQRSQLPQTLAQNTCQPIYLQALYNNKMYVIIIDPHSLAIIPAQDFFCGISAGFWAGDTQPSVMYCPNSGDGPNIYCILQQLITTSRSGFRDSLQKILQRYKPINTPPPQALHAPLPLLGQDSPSSGQNSSLHEEMAGSLSCTSSPPLPQWNEFMAEVEQALAHGPETWPSDLRAMLEIDHNRS